MAAKAIGRIQRELLRRLYVLPSGLTKGEMASSSAWRAADTLEERGLIERIWIDGIGPVYKINDAGRAAATSFITQAQAR